MPEPEKFLGNCVGKWRGTVKTWFEPGKLADESKVSGEIVSLLNGNFFRHTYEGSMKGKPRHGEETKDFDHLTITAYNIMPDGQESKAVETVYERVKE